MLYQMLTNFLPEQTGDPFGANATPPAKDDLKNISDALTSHFSSTSNPLWPSTFNPTVPPKLDTIVLKLLAPILAQRYQDVTEFLADLEALRPVDSQTQHSPVDATPFTLPTSDEQIALLKTQIRALLAIASEESIHLNNYYLGTEHLFLALLQSLNEEVTPLLGRLNQSKETINQARSSVN